MTTSTLPDPMPQQWTSSPVIDYEPAPEAPGPRRGPVCAAPSVESLHRFAQRPARRPPGHPCEPPPPRSAVVFAETALRQVIEVIDRRRPIAQLRPLMTPVLVDRVIAHAGTARGGSATMRRVRVRAVEDGGTPDDVSAAEVFASFTRCGRVHAVAARIERYRDRWRMVALQIG
ncbi:Rv3235 family protein [Mycolicibacterium hippocampi]|uniref:Rv3235 family protein n=1 Tax=Mycolicibacterium hippocampi TaxID=659824 RepID=UPI003513D265